MDTQTDFLSYFGDDAELVKVPAEATIFKEGDEGDYMYVVKSGKVRIETHGRELAVIGVGEIFGEMSMIDRVQRSAAAVALSDCVLVPVDSGTFLALVDSMPFFSLELLRVFTARIRTMNRMVQAA
jgi:CRP-like cAMP-binding protein